MSNTHITVESGKITKFSGPDYVQHDENSYTGDDWFIRIYNGLFSAATPAVAKEGSARMTKYKRLRDGLYILTGGDFINRQLLFLEKS
jgi:hypothetical protein